MSRFRGQWLPDDGSDRPWRLQAGLPDAAAFVVPEAEAAERGRWLEGGPAPVDDEPRPRAGSTVPVPGWTGYMPAVAGLLVAFALVLALAGNTNVLSGLIVVAVLAAIVHRVAQRLAKADGQPAVVPIVMGGFVAKVVGIVMRYYVAFGLYGRADATEYDRYGRAYAPLIRHGTIPDTGRLTGSNFIRLLAGFVYAAIPPSMLAAFFVFGFFSFVGMLCFWRAYRRAVSDRNDLKVLQVLVLLPSLLFWPSALGKDAWMLLAVGVAAYGAANILTNRTVVGWCTFSLGMIAIAQVRPHVGIPLFAGLLLAELFRSRGSQGAGRAALNIVLLLVIGSAILAATAKYVGVGNWSQASVQQELDNVQGRTAEGGSNFHPYPVNSPVQFPPAAITVLFRPLPFEAHSPQELVTAIEDLVLLGYTIKNARKVVAAFREARRRPYLLFCIGTITLFIVEYSTFSNFGLLARERTQITPFVLTLLLVPTMERVQVASGRLRRAPAPAPSRPQ